MLYAIVVAVIVVVAFLWWRYGSVERGARRRDEKIVRLLDPVAIKFERKEEVSAEEIAILAAQPHLRRPIYELLKHFERLDLFPAHYRDLRSQGEADLAYWLLHPNELDAVPDQIELIESVTRSLARIEEVEFLVFRFRAAEGHWAAGDGWLLGLAGPYRRNDVPYSGFSSAFSRFDRADAVQPNELVDWYIAMLRKKGAIPEEENAR